jgi:plastocyanin
VKVGTKITWVNQSSAPHTVTAIKGLNPGQEVADPSVFDSGLSTPIAPTSGTYTYTVTQAAYNANSSHEVIYYCQFHPAMLAMITIVQ